MRRHTDEAVKAGGVLFVHLINMLLLHHTDWACVSVNHAMSTVKKQHPFPLNLVRMFVFECVLHVCV